MLALYKAFVYNTHIKQTLTFGVNKMGAHFQTQIKAKGEKSKFVVYPVGYSKFLENFYYASIAQQAILHYLKNSTDSLNPIAIRTVCDYDSKETVKSLTGKPILKSAGNNFKCAEIEKTKRHLNTTDYDDWDMVNTGYIVCDETKTAINLETIAMADKDEKKWVICPLALLTRATTTRQGGGDINSDEVNSKYIATWYGLDIYYSDNLPVGFIDISNEIIFLE